MDPKHSHGPDRIDYRETPEDLSEVHAAILRENPEPSASVTPIPLWLITICGLAVSSAGAYLGLFHGGFRGDVFNERQSSPDLLFPQVAKAGAAGAAAPVAELPLAEQGKAIFAQNCQVCHQPTGLGVAGQFPPLAGSEFVTGSEKRLASIVLKGLGGSVTVKGAAFNGAMPAWETVLTDKKAAAVLSYIRSAFGNSAPEITPGKITSARKEFSARTAPMTEAEVNQIPADATLQDANPAPAAAPAAGAAAAPAPAAGGAPAASAGAGEATPEQIAAGKTVYMTICFACHQATGAGIPMTFPPLTKSEYVNGPADRFAAMILKGNLPPMTVNGTLYAASPMPAQEAVLSDEKIAAVMTYVRASFDNHSAPVTADVVAAVRKKFAGRTTSWKEEELKSFDTIPAAPAP